MRSMKKILALLLCVLMLSGVWGAAENAGAGDAAAQFYPSPSLSDEDIPLDFETDPETLTDEEVALLMAEGVQAKGMQEIFEKDRENQKELKESINVMVDRLKQNYDEEMDTMALVSLLLSFAGIAAYCRKTSEAIIDRFFIEDTKEKNTK